MKNSFIFSFKNLLVFILIVFLLPSIHFSLYGKNSFALNNRLENLNLDSETTVKKSIEENVLNEEELNFSHQRNLYYLPFKLEITSNLPGARIIYTTDCSIPTEENGTVYENGIQIDSTIIIKAVAVIGNSRSEVFTNSYLFPAFIAKQAKKPAGFPETWGGYAIIPADYEMDSAIISSPEYSSQIQDAFESLPSLSLSMNVEEWFNHETGLYVGYPNSNETREKAVTAEFVFNNDSEENFAVACGVQNQGGTSIVKWKSPKQSMRLLFKEEFGPTRLERKLFTDSEINSINTLVVDAMLNATWIHPTDDKQRIHALYLRDQLTSDIYNKMGGLSFHGRYFNLYLNGLYWGICNLHERPDDAFLSEYLDDSRDNFDIIKHNPDRIVSGSNDFYISMLESARLGFASYQSLKDFEKYLDLPAFIDYMLLNFYLGNFDWAHQNYYAGRNKLESNGFRFYPWDSEHVMRFANVNYDNTDKNNEGGPTEIHTLLKENEEYRLMFADAVYKHLFNNGALTPDSFEKNFQFRVDEIEKAIILESARWGDYRKDVSMVTYTKNDYWIPEVNLIFNEYIPKRRDIVIDQLRAVENKLFPNNMPPVIEVENQTGGAKKVKLVNLNAGGDIYFTLDGTDPRKVGGEINGIKYSGEIEIKNTAVLKARFYSPTYSGWSALAEQVFMFDNIFGEDLVINEIMYHPDSDYPEFIELMNFGETSINLKGYTISGGIEYNFIEDKLIQPKGGIVLTNDVVLFKAAYKYNAFGMYLKQLNNKGETIILKNMYNQLVDSVTYSDTIPWPELADGDGYSLELIDPEMDNALFSSWKLSDKLYGSPYNSETKLELNAGIYPNPFSSVINVQIENSGLTNERFRIEIFSQTGSKIRSIITNGYNSKFEFNLGEVPPGIYFVRVQPEENTAFESVVFKAIKLK